MKKLHSKKSRIIHCPSWLETKMDTIRGADVQHWVETLHWFVHDWTPTKPVYSSGGSKHLYGLMDIANWYIKTKTYNSGCFVVTTLLIGCHWLTVSECQPTHLNDQYSVIFPGSFQGFDWYSVLSCKGNVVCRKRNSRTSWGRMNELHQCKMQMLYLFKAPEKHCRWFWGDRPKTHVLRFQIWKTWLPLAKSQYDLPYKL